MTLTSGVRTKVVVGAAGALAVALCVGVGWIIFGKSGDAPPTAADTRALADEACPRVVTPHFYRITKAGKTSYLLGTRHAGVSLAKYPPSVAQAFHDAKVAVFESIEPVGSDRPAAAPPASAQSVSDALGPDLWDHYRDLVGDDLAARVEHRSILMATAALSLLYEDTSQTVDRELTGLARSSGKQLVALEDADVTDHLSENYLGVDTLKTALHQIPRRALLANQTRHDLRVYCNGPRPIADTEGPIDAVTNRRSRTWVPKLVPILTEGGAFIAVGGMHVDEGSLDLGKLLAAEGFDVNAVSN